MRMSFNDLPEDIIEYILLHLTPYGDLQICRQVNRQWYRLSTGALQRLIRLFNRCDKFDWYLLQVAESVKYTANIAERCSHAACYHPNGTMYVFGGCTAAYTTFNDLWKFDLASRSWARPIPIGTFPTPKACASMVQYRGCLVLFGGWSKSSPNPIHQTAMFFNELHVYDPKNNWWTQISNDGTAPHLAGHSATAIKDDMIVFGGSFGNGSSNVVWVFDFITRQWSQPQTSHPKPTPRYGQSQVTLDSTHILIVGGCGGPNMIFHDVWLLTIETEGDHIWKWEEVTVTNGQMSAPQLWSHAACKIDDKLVVLSKPLRSQGSGLGPHRAMSASQHTASGSSIYAKTWIPPQGNLIPPRKKLLSSRSLDEKEPPPSPKSTEGRTTELQRASSIPAIIVGEIPKLVVTKDDNSDDSSGSDSGAPGSSNQSPCIAMVASSLLPNQATQINPPVVPNVAETSRPTRGRSQPSIKPNASNDRSRRLELLRRMEEYIRSRPSSSSGANGGCNSCGHCSSCGQSSGGKMRFRPRSPPPKSKHHRPADFVLSRFPMNIYVLELGQVLEHKRVTWRIVDGNVDAPEDTILYSLIKARGELVMFGGMRSSNPIEQQGLDVTPFSHTITNETYILRPQIAL